MLLDKENKYLKKNISHLSHCTHYSNINSILDSGFLIPIYMNKETETTKVFVVPLYKHDKEIENRSCVLLQKTMVEFLLSVDILNDSEFYIGRIIHQGNMEYSLYLSPDIRNILEGANSDKHKFKQLIKKNNKINKKYKKVLYHETKYLFKNKFYKNNLKDVLSKKRIYEIGLFCDIDLSKYLVAVRYYNPKLEHFFDYYKDKYPNTEFVLGNAYTKTVD